MSCDCSISLREEVEEFLALMDRDFDGRLTFEEFMGEECLLEKLFKSMDKDGDGLVSKDEFLKICKNLTDEQVLGYSLEYSQGGLIFYIAG